MKKTLLSLVAFIMVVASANAQIEQGAISIGGMLNVSSSTGKTTTGSTTVDSPKYSSFTFGPQVGYFLSEKISIGAGLLYSRSVTTSVDVDGETKNINSIFNFSPFGRYHIAMGEKFYAFGEARFNVGIGGSKVKNDSNSADTGDLTTFGFSVSPGVVFFPGERVGIELSVNLLSFTTEADKDPEGNGKDVDTNFSFGPNLFSPNLGIQLYF